MKQEDIFGDYTPKKTPDTIYDYFRKPDSRLYEIFDELGVTREELIPSIEITMFKKALNYFHQYKKKAETNPGTFVDGTPLLGAPLKEYIPSEEELIVSELGNLIQNLLFTHTLNEVQKYKKEHDIMEYEIIYNPIEFTHADVMGSGRFFYAEKAKEQIRLSF